MDARTYKRMLMKRQIEISDDADRPKKKLTEIVTEDGIGRVYQFKVLLPNGICLGFKMTRLKSIIPIQEFVETVKHEYFQIIRKPDPPKPRRKINWQNQYLHFVDEFDNKIRKGLDFNDFKPNKCHILRLQDGSGESETYENMWDLTPDTDLLKELPEEYTFETALADLIDNSLQAVWSNDVNERRLISVEVVKGRISIFDTGKGMDGSHENSIVKWGKIGASLHRSSKGQAIGGKPPYLTPCFGMFGYGGPIASMHLGRWAVVSSKTKESKKVYTLHLERDALLSSSSSELTWRTNGGLRDPSEVETAESRNGSFTKVDIFEPKMTSSGVLQLQCKLKDIYFPYVQCDEMSNAGRTATPIEFQVNGVDLAGIEGGEVAITNLHSCNGPDFVVQLHFCFNQDTAAMSSPGKNSIYHEKSGLRAYQEANARLKCVYFPIVEGKESIENILEKLEADGCIITENYESFSRVSIRRLGRLLPDARWAWLPFMELKQRKGDRAQMLKRCCFRVKCFIETDAGFSPTPSKTDLAHHHPYTIALKNFGGKFHEKEKEVHIEIYKDGKPLNLVQLERQYQDWIVQMHQQYDMEIDSGVDQPVLIVNPLNKKALGISSDVVRVHKIVQRKGTSWESGQKIKILKGACAGCHKKNIYATLECILLEGFQGDADGEARLICRPLDLPEENGYLLTVKDGNSHLDNRGSLSIPIHVIDSGKCLAIGPEEWNDQLDKQHQKTPSLIQILSAKHCHELEVKEALPDVVVVEAGYVPPEEIVAVIRPTSFNLASASKNLDQKHIIKENVEMTLEIKFKPQDKDLQGLEHIYSGRIAPSSRKEIHGLYIFALKSKLPELFQKAGIYILSFSIKEFAVKNCEKKIHVKPLSVIEKWGLISDEQGAQCSVRVGLCFPHFHIACYDRYKNCTSFTRVPEVVAKVISEWGVLAHVNNVMVHIEPNGLRVKDVLIESSELDKIRPSYGATLIICLQDESLSVACRCQVFPGLLHRVTAKPPNYGKNLLPGHVIKEIVLEMFDAYGNHVKEGEEIMINLDGFCFQDKTSSMRKVDDGGFIDLSGLLKVTKAYGEKVSLSVLTSNRVAFKEEFQIENRVLRTTSRLPISCAAGSQLENMVFEIVNSDGDVDEGVHDEEKHGQSHTLLIKSESLDIDDSVRYSFRHGRCTIRSLLLPQREGIFVLVAAHSRYPKISLSIEVHIEQARDVERGSIQSPCSDQRIFLSQDTSAFNTPTIEDNDVQHQYSKGKILLLQDSSAPKDLELLFGSIMNDQKELEKNVFKYGSSVGKLEEFLKMLNDQQAAIEQDISLLQGDIGLDSSDDLGYTAGKEVMMEHIECKDYAAAVVLKCSRAIHFQMQQNFMKDILGVVAFLGTVQTNELSRILAEYLGEDQMLAIVCKSYAAAGALEKYESNGQIDHACAIYALATDLGKSVNGRYLVVCLENISPYTGELGSDPQRLLALPDPVLPNGKTPPGYLGYAVNMVNLDANHLYTRTTAGHGLRETIFYRLFGELQVYENREYMKMADSYIKHGAVSLDGGIMRGNGVISLGYWEPSIQFPIVTKESQVNLSPFNQFTLKQIQEKKLEVRQVVFKKECATKSYKKILKKYNIAKARYLKFLDEKEPMLQSLEFRPSMNNHNNSIVDDHPTTF